MNVHRVTIGGRLGMDPELRKLESGKVVCNISVATNEAKKNEKGEFEKTVVWHNASIWGKSAQWVGENLKKGDGVFLEGKNEYLTWHDENGNKRSSVKIKVSNIQAFGGKDESFTTEQIPF